MIFLHFYKLTDGLDIEYLIELIIINYHLKEHQHLPERLLEEPITHKPVIGS